MKFASMVALLALVVRLVVNAAVLSERSDRTITQVVKLLQNLLEKAQAEGDEERTLYGKYTCYCDTNEASKKAEIDSLTKNIGLLESKIEVLLSSNGVLSSDVATLKADMASNLEARNQAVAIRTKDHGAFVALDADLTAALDQLARALQTLSAIGADQTLQTATDHDKFMAKYQPAMLLRLRQNVKQALVAAGAFVQKEKLQKAESLLQAPFTGTYTAQAGEVVGILKDLEDTFKENLDTARTSETAAEEAHGRYMSIALSAYDAMLESYNAKQAQLAANDEDLAGKKTQMQGAQSQKAEAEQFLAELLLACAKKAKEYDQRTTLRASELAAVSEAIAILNSDAAFETFGTVTATSSGPVSLLQRRSVQLHKHEASAEHQAQRLRARDVLRRAAGSMARPVLLSRVLALLEVDNPFTVVLQEIEKMLTVITEEAKVDDQQLAWCTSERATSDATIQEKTTEISSLIAQIDTLVQAINNPVTGLQVMIQGTEAALQTNINSQSAITAERRKSTADYQENIENLSEAEALLTKAVSVLRTYYAQILRNQGSMLQASPAGPSTWGGAYEGQSAHGGTDAISMLEFILSNARQEEAVAHTDEQSAQTDYEDTLARLTAERATLGENLAQLKATLAQSETELLGKREDLQATEADKAAVEVYLQRIKAGCDFITNNIGLRRSDREQETTALQTAADLLRSTPAYQSAVVAAHDESLGECLDVCKGKEAHVDCKACLADVTVPAYCAGHAGTEGC